ncbi:hypothetical protein FDZ73_20880 [bacterium]|nr:MAG: hypothetical protein FDZ73_20880 [bacterium]
MWEEIHGFQSFSEYEKFSHFVESKVQSGIVKEIEPLPEYHKGYVYGGRWFEDLQSGRKWRLVPPDFPFRGLWEQVEELGIL